MDTEHTERDLDETPTPDQRCPICLQRFEDKVVLNNCFHAFCRFCIAQWAEYEPAKRHGKNRCPLCRTQFQALYHNYSEETHAYDVTHLDADANTAHWSQYQAEEEAIRIQTSETKNEAVARHRRLLVYFQTLIPIIDFKIPKLPADRASSGYTSILKKVSLQFQSKAPQFIARELPILLFHNTMIPGTSSFQQQQSEVSLLNDLLMALILPAIPTLLSLVFLRSQSDASKDDESLLSSISPRDTALDALYEAMSEFLADSTLAFLRELTLFVVSPWTLDLFDRNLTYSDC